MAAEDGRELMEVLIGITAVLAWLGGIFLVMARGYLLPAIRTEEFQLEIAAEPGWFDGIETPTIQPGSRPIRTHSPVSCAVAKMSESGNRASSRTPGSTIRSTGRRCADAGASTT
jgi:hypothetical protein